MGVRLSKKKKKNEPNERTFQYEMECARCYYYQFKICH